MQEKKNECSPPTGELNFFQGGHTLSWVWGIWLSARSL